MSHEFEQILIGPSGFETFVAEGDVLGVASQDVEGQASSYKNRTSLQATNKPAPTESHRRAVGTRRRPYFSLSVASHELRQGRLATACFVRGLMGIGLLGVFIM